jgi:uncharacterized protein
VVASRALIDEFFTNKRIALMRSNPAKVVRGGIDEELAPKGYEVDVVYLEPGDTGRRLSDLAEPPAAAIIAVTAKESEAAVREAVAAGVPRLWLQAGCASEEAIELCEKSGIPTIHGACVMMYAEPVEGVHKFHRGIVKFFGRLAK